MGTANCTVKVLKNMDNVKQYEGKKKQLQKQTNLTKIINKVKKNNKTYLNVEVKTSGY